MLFIIILVAATQLCLFLAFGIMPYVTRRNISFGISVPADAQSLPEIRRLKRRYLLWCGVLAAVTAAPAFLLLAAGFGDTAAIIAYTISTLAYTLAAFLLYLSCYRRVKRMKKERGWTVQREQVSVASATPGYVPPSLMWIVIPALLCVAASVAIGFAFYDGLPDLVATHWGADMQPNGFTEKGPGLIWTLPAIQGMMGAIMGIAYAAISKSRRRLEAADPEGSMRREQIFRKSWAWYMILLSGLLCASFTLIQAATFQIFSAGVAFAVVMGIAGFSVAGAIVLSVVVGQGGSRLRGKPQKTSAQIDYDDDRFWKLGASIYYNPDDPAVFVEKRFGVGFTSNFARPMTWVLMIGLVAVIVGSLIVTFIIAG